MKPLRGLSGAAILLVTLGIAGDFDPVSAQASARPNILIILTDDQRATGTMWVMPETRAIFGGGGTRYKNAVATTPLCCPSRASIFSGRYAHNHGVMSNASAGNLDQGDTIQAQLDRAGYRTAVAGKFLNQFPSSPAHFDRWAVHQGDRYFDATFDLDGTARTVPGYATEVIGDKAREFLADFESTDAAPWMLQVSPFAPHTPATPDSGYATAPVPSFDATPATEEQSLADKPAYVREKVNDRARVLAFRDKQLRALKSVDDEIAKLFTTLTDLREADNTLAFFLSDNGYMWFEHRLANKRVPYDDSIRIPFFARWPGHIPGGRKLSRVVANIDIAPTVYQATGVVPDYTVDGKSLFTSRRTEILTEYFVDVGPVPAWQQMWSPGRTYAVYPELPGRPREYYTARDEWQLANAYGDRTAGNEPEDEAALDAWLKAAVSCSGASCP